MQTISRLPSLSIPSSAEVASNIIGGSFYMQLYSILQTNMLQRVNPPLKFARKKKRTPTYPAQNEEPELSGLLMSHSCPLLQDQILNAMKQVSGCDMASPGIPSMASQCIPSTSRSTSPSGAVSVDRSMVSICSILMNIKGL
jgi:serine/threonine-protein kinase OSR1/STK39